MKPLDTTRVPWKLAGPSLERLLRLERDATGYGHATFELLNSIADEGDSSSWREYLLRGDNLDDVLELIGTAVEGGERPDATLLAIRRVIESAYANDSVTAGPFVGRYLKAWPLIPATIRQELDRLVASGDVSIPKVAVVFAVEAETFKPAASRNEWDRDIFEHWYRAILAGDVPEDEAAAVPAQMAAAEERLWEHLRDVLPKLSRESGTDVQADDPTFYGRYSYILTSHRIQELTESAIVARDGGLRIDAVKVERYLTDRDGGEAVARLSKVATWMEQVNQQNHDGVVLTPPVNEYLAGPEDVDALIGEIERLRTETREGRFDVSNDLQRELEYIRYATEYSWQYDEPRDTPEQYAAFGELELLPPQDEPEFELDGKHLVEAGRIAYEAFLFLRFLQRWRASTSRPIVVVGNDRYGRQWATEPIEDFLSDGFTVRTFRNPSHKSMRLMVRHELYGHVRMGFTRDFVEELDRESPHVVVVDSCGPRESDSVMRLSRGQRDYVNWFMLFNDIRAEGDALKYEPYSGLPASHFPELRNWHEYERVRRQIREYVNPGPVYKVAHWAPVKRDTVLLGDFLVPRRDVDLDDEGPWAVIANPAFYPGDGEDVPDALRGTQPYYFDGPEKYEQEKVVFGFGSHGLETRIEGTTVDTFVAEVQRHMKAEIARLLQQGQ